MNNNIYLRICYGLDEKNLELLPGTTVKDLYVQVRRLNFIDTDNICLKFGNRKLDQDDRTALASYNISDGSIIDLCRCDGKIQLYIEFDNQRRTFPTDPDIKLKDLYKNIKELKWIDNNDILLYFNGSRLLLNDDKTLKSLHIIDHSCIKLLPGSHLIHLRIKFESTIKELNIPYSATLKELYQKVGKLFPFKTPWYQQRPGFILLYESNELENTNKIKLCDCEFQHCAIITVIVSVVGGYVPVWDTYPYILYPILDIYIYLPSRPYMSSNYVCIDLCNLLPLIIYYLHS